MSSPRAATSVAMSRSALARAKLLHHAVALLLRHAAVQRLGAIAARVQRLGQLVHFGARAAEDDRRRRASPCRARGRASAILCARGTMYATGARAAIVPARQLARARSSRAPGPSGAAWRSPRCAAACVAEKSAVCRVFGVALEDRLEVLGEAHVEHLVGFVEDHDLHAARARSVLRRM